MNRFRERMRQPVLLLVPVLLFQAIWSGTSSAKKPQDSVEQESAKAWVGKNAKAFTLPGIDGKPVNVGRQFGKRPVLLVFYRGVWCPYCHAQMGQLGKIETELKNAHATIFCISNEDAADLKKMKDHENLSDAFVFLSDPGAKEADNYAGHYPDKTVLKPATFVIGSHGKIVYAYVGENFKVRADASAVLEAVKKAGK